MMKMIVKAEKYLKLKIYKQANKQTNKFYTETRVRTNLPL